MREPGFLWSRNEFTQLSLHLLAEYYCTTRRDGGENGPPRDETTLATAAAMAASAEWRRSGERASCEARRPSVRPSLYQVDKSYTHDLRGRKERISSGRKEGRRGASFGIKGAPFRELGQNSEERKGVRRAKTDRKRNSDGKVDRHAICRNVVGRGKGILI